MCGLLWWWFCIQHSLNMWFLDPFVKNTVSELCTYISYNLIYLHHFHICIWINILVSHTGHTPAKEWWGYRASKGPRKQWIQLRMMKRGSEMCLGCVHSYHTICLAWNRRMEGSRKEVFWGESLWSFLETLEILKDLIKINSWRTERQFKTPWKTKSYAMGPLHLMNHFHRGRLDF